MSSSIRSQAILWRQNSTDLTAESSFVAQAASEERGIQSVTSTQGRIAGRAIGTERVAQLFQREPVS